MSAATPANIFLGTGRRKTSTARVRITEGTGKLSVNGREFEKYFSHENFAKQAYAPLLTVELREKIDVTANVAGGGVTGQAGAVAHGIDFEATFRPELEALRTLEADGLVERAGAQLRVTPVGQLLLRNVASVFDAYLLAPAGPRHHSTAV